MYQKHVDPTAFMAAHAAGLKDAELAAMFSISRATVKRRRKEFRLGSNCLSNNKGALGEQLVAEFMRREGLNVTETASKAPYDLLVNGLRVDVKVGLRRPSAHIAVPSYQFRLPPLRTSYQASKVYSKDYQRDTDYLALAVIENDQLQHLYTVPTRFWRPTITVTPGSRDCDYQEFRDDLQNFEITGAWVET
ncbi:hypothetical protein [Deinococcus fonticola]|uniref:hypothetical protein n=1 Tax=Deinococcus fonticola TaxID=2528713 RepID=UPI001075161F|nr:hypothetical protein [Deinococcus fonticola]